MVSKKDIHLTSYDFLKAIAVLLMIVDHVGYYFYPDDDVLRVIGRLCVPIWFFLVGYAKSRDFGPFLWIGCGILIFANYAVGLSFFPLNILASILFVRWALDPAMARIVPGFQRDEINQRFWAFCVFLVLCAVPSSLVTEYGTQGLLLAMLGYLARHMKDLPEDKAKNIIQVYALFVAFVYIISETILFAFDREHMFALAAGVFVIVFLLPYFQPQAYPNFTKKTPRVVVVTLKLLGRRTLEIYVIHLLAFKVIAANWDPERFPLWTWQWVLL